VKLKLAIAATALAANILLFMFLAFRRSEIDSMTARLPSKSADARQIEKLTRWHSAQATDISDRDLRAGLARLPSRGCEFKPLAAEYQSFTELDSSIREALLSTLIELLEAYRDNNPGKLVEFMERRGESLTDRAEAACRKALIEGHGMSNSKVDALSSVDAYLTWADAGGFSPNWDAIVLDESCLSIWRYSGKLSEVVSFNEMQKQQTEVWRSTITPLKRFQPVPKMSLQTHIGHPTLFADLVIIVHHNSVYRNDRSPYAFRFWYDDRIANWRALFVTHFPVPGSAIKERGFVSLSI
jgi:hypothetical protein